jgi:predicted nucleotidyltransferase component of viral defense system
MLYLSTVDTPALELLKFLMSKKEFQHLRLVGGTALALQLGHRKSIDLDLFGEIEFEDIDLTKVLNKYSDKIILLKKSKNINILSIDHVKVDFVNYSYPWLEKFLEIDGIRFASFNDIAAMKLSAITGRGSRKDFIDLFFLLQKNSLKEFLGFYRQKYFDGSEYLVLKSLTYFEDAETDPDIEMLVKVSWPEVKQYILRAVNEYNQSI